MIRGQLLEYLNSGDFYQLMPIHKRGRWIFACIDVISPTLSSSTLQKSVNDAFDTNGKAAAANTLQLRIYDEHDAR